MSAVPKIQVVADIETQAEAAEGCFHAAARKNCRARLVKGDFADRVRQTWARVLREWAELHETGFELAKQAEPARGDIESRAA